MISGNLSSYIKEEEKQPFHLKICRNCFELLLMEWCTIFAATSLLGGCCSNVLTLESIIKYQDPAIADLLTFCQFLIVSVEGIFTFVDITGGVPSLKPLNIPLRVYVTSVLLYYVSSVTNNSVFKYGISVPLHIIFRSSGIVITMIISRTFTSRRYSNLQMFAAFLLTVGAIITSIFKDSEIKLSSIQNLLDETGNRSHMSHRTLKGIGLIIVSSIASSSLSVYTEFAYRKHGNHWKENLFYTHALSLPLFLTQRNSLYQNFSSMLNSNIKSSIKIRSLVATFDTRLLFIANILTQQACIKGVNLFASRTSALTLSVALLFRKFLSLLLSFYIFGSDLPPLCYFGIVLVFLGASIYALAPNTPTTVSKLRKKD